MCLLSLSTYKEKMPILFFNFNEHCGLNKHVIKNKNTQNLQFQYHLISDYLHTHIHIFTYLQNTYLKKKKMRLTP